MPTPTKYTYNQDVANLDLLTTTIAASPIAQTLDRIDRVADSPNAIDIWFPDVLIAADQTTLDNILSDHDLGEAKAAKKQAIKNHRDYLLYVVKYLWTDSNSYDIDTTSQFKMAATLAFTNSGNDLPSGFTWRDANNLDQGFTKQTFQDFTKDLWTRGNDIHDASKTHKDNVDAKTTVADVDAYDYTINPTWPA